MALSGTPILSHRNPIDKCEVAMSKRAWTCCTEDQGVSPVGTASSADLGGSSKYSNENFEDRSGEGFRENSNWSRVSRS